MQFRSPLTVMLFVVPLLAADGVSSMEAQPIEPVQAAWNQQEVNFVYMGRTSFYTCRSLEDRVRSVMKEIGARDDLIVRTSGCFDSFAPERFIQVRMVVAIPKVVSPGVGLSQEEKSRLELIAKVRGESKPTSDSDSSAAEPALDQFPASWEKIRFNSRSRILDDGDCELLEHLEERVFPKLEIRVVKDGLFCFPGQVRLGQLDLEVEVLKALPSADDPG